MIKSIFINIHFVNTFLCLYIHKKKFGSQLECTRNKYLNFLINITDKIIGVIQKWPGGKGIFDIWCREKCPLEVTTTIFSTICYMNLRGPILYMQKGILTIVLIFLMFVWSKQWNAKSKGLHSTLPQRMLNTLYLLHSLNKSMVVIGSNLEKSFILFYTRFFFTIDLNKYLYVWIKTWGVPCPYKYIRE